MSANITVRERYARTLHDILRALPDYLALVERLKLEHKSAIISDEGVYTITPRFQELAEDIAKRLELRDVPNSKEQRWANFYHSIWDVAERVSQ